MDLLEDALSLFVSILDKKETKMQKSEKELWMELTEFIAKYP